MATTVEDQNPDKSHLDSNSSGSDSANQTRKQVPTTQIISLRTITVAFFFLFLGLGVTWLFSPGTFRNRTINLPHWHLQNDSGYVIGIDLGTEHVRIALQRNGTVDVLPFIINTTASPTWTGFRSNMTEDIGAPVEAQRQWGRSGHESAVQIMTFLFSKVKKQTEAYLGMPINHAVVSVPTHFDDAKRQAIKDAGQLAGISVQRLVNDPTAAGIGFGLNKLRDEFNVLVVDFGFNLDVSLMSIDEGVFEILGTAGESTLGEGGFVGPVVDYIVNKKYQTPSELLRVTTSDSHFFEKLTGAVQHALNELLTQESVAIVVHDQMGNVLLSRSLTEGEVEEINKPRLQKVLLYVEQAMGLANVTKDRIEHFALIGGGSQNPGVKRLLTEYLGKEPFDSTPGFPPSEAIVHGVAIQGGLISDSHEDLCTCCDWSINSLTLGVETSGGMFTPMVQRNSVIPTRRQMNFSTTEPDREGLSAVVKIYEGERACAVHNNLLGALDLGPVSVQTKGGLELQVTISVNMENDVEVEVEELNSGKITSLSIKMEQRLSYARGRTPGGPDPIENVILEAEKYLEEDQAIRRRAEVTSLNQQLLQSVLLWTEKMIPQDREEWLLAQANYGPAIFEEEKHAWWNKENHHDRPSIEVLEARYEAAKRAADTLIGQLPEPKPPKLKIELQDQKIVCEL